MTSTNMTADLPQKTNKGRLRWATVLTVLLAVILLYFSFRGANWQEMIGTFAKGNLEFLGAAFFILIFSYFLRSLRWQVLLNSEGTVPLSTTFWATSIGYLGNSVLPARAGEVIRSVLITRKSSLTLSYVFATALTERVLDALALVLFGSIALVVVGSIPDWLISAAKVFAVLGVVGLGTFYILPRLENLIARFIHWLPLPSRFKAPIVTLMQEFLTGMRAIHNPRRLLAFVGLTVAIWTVDVIAALLVASAFGITLTVAQMMIMLAAMGLSSAAPSTPGFVGIYQFVAVTVLVPFGLTQNQALIFIIAFQAVSYLVVFVTGGLGLWRLNAFGQNLSKLAKTPLPPIESATATESSD